jgi:hypothetical protein
MIKYVFACACGCGQVSEPLGKDYRRLLFTKWYAKGCQPENLQKKEFCGGFLVEIEKQTQNGKTENF